MSEMVLSAGIPVKLGAVNGMLFGGKFRNYVQGTRRLVGVKMAAEISHPHEISIPTNDFSVPKLGVMEAGILEGLRNLSEGNDLYAGCMGGIGRTGLYMGCMAKVCIDYHGGEYMGFTDPVTLVRATYLGHALETDEQQAYARDFPTGPALQWLKERNQPKVVVETVEREVERVVERIVEVPTSPWAWIKARIFG